MMIAASVASFTLAWPAAAQQPPRHPAAKARSQESFPDRVEAAVRASDAGALIALARENPGAFGCGRLAWAWALGEAYAKTKRPRDAQALAERLLDGSCTDDERLATLYKARGWIPAAEWATLVEREAPRPRSVEIDGKFRALQYDLRLAPFYAAQSAKDPQAARLFEALAGEVELRRDAGAALAAAWLYFNANDIAAADRWFGKALQWQPDAQDARYGVALCAAKEGRYADALKAARELPPGYPDRDRLIHDALLVEARSAFEAKRYDGAVDALREAQSLAPLPRYARALLGWSLLQAGDAEAAASTFEQLYREQPDEESASGLVASVQRSGKGVSSLRALAVTEPLASIFRRDETRRMLDEKRYMSASRADAGLAPTLGAAGVPNASLASAIREKSGSEGTSRLRTRLSPSLEGGMPVGADSELFVRVDRVRLESGTLPSNALVGSAGSGPYAFAPVTEVDGAQPQLFVRMERESIWQLNIGLTPSDAPLQQHIFGRLERRAFAPWGLYDVAAFAEPVRESILSYVGWRDPYTGATWGRVLRYGAEARGLWLRNLPWAMGGSARWERLQGEQVADNDHFHADASLGRNLGLRGFEYAAFGVETRYDGYRRNLSPFTLGNGGYYSPQKALYGGVALNFQTEERRPWVVRGRWSAGRVDRVQDDAQFFPLAPDGRTFAGSRDYGNETNAEVSGIWQVTQRLQAGVILARSRAPQYDSRTGALVLRVLFERRSAVTSADLPARLFQDLR